VNPVCVDLYCGKGGWTNGFLEAGFTVIGVDIQFHKGYRGLFLQRDIAAWNGNGITTADVIVASPPCDEFSRFQMPWTRRKNPLAPSMELVNAAYRLREVFRPRVFILENVRAAQQWLGPAILHRGPYYLWGDILLAPAVVAKAKESYSGSQKAERAMIPFDLAYGIALSCKSRLAAR